MKNIIVFIMVWSLSVIGGHSRAAADELWMKNGDRITGKIIRLEADSLMIDTGYAGEISIDWKQIENIKTDAPVKIVLGGGTTIQGFVSPGREGKVTVRSEDLVEALDIELAELKVINPKPPPPALKTKARVNFGASFTDGNTKTETIYGDGELVARTKKNRYTLGGVYKRSEDNNVTTADSVIAYMKYDHFLTDRWFLYANAAGEKDPFKDLNLRSSLSTGLGYQFFETELTNLSLEAGISYVHNDYIENDDDGYAAGRWGLRFDHYFLKKALQFFLNNTGMQSLEDSDDLIIYTQTGFRIPFYKNLNVTMQVNYDYDKSPSPGREKYDAAYIFSLGYQWGE